MRKKNPEEAVLISRAASLRESKGLLFAVFHLGL